MFSVALGRYDRYVSHILTGLWLNLANITLVLIARYTHSIGTLKMPVKAINFRAF